MTHDHAEPLTRRLIDALHVEAMLLADESRAYFDETGRAERDGLPPLGRVAFACESLKITTRLMHVIAWLIARREGAPQDRRAPRPLGRAPDTDIESLASMPPTARMLIEASLELHARVARIDAGLSDAVAAESPALGLLDRLQRAF